MILSFVFIALVIIASGLCFLFISLQRAPDGFEDATGFHALKLKDKSSQRFHQSPHALGSLPSSKARRLYQKMESGSKRHVEVA